MPLQGRVFTRIALEQFHDRAGKAREDIMISALTAVARSLYRYSPVVTGKYRANHQFGMTRNRTIFTPRRNSLRSMNARIRFTVRRNANRLKEGCFFNNVPYAQSVERRHGVYKFSRGAARIAAAFRPFTRRSS